SRRGDSDNGARDRLLQRLSCERANSAMDCLSRRHDGLTKTTNRLCTECSSVLRGIFRDLRDTRAFESAQSLSLSRALTPDLIDASQIATLRIAADAKLPTISSCCEARIGVSRVRWNR